MLELNYVAIVVAGLWVFAFAAVYYTLFARQRAALSQVAASRSRPSARLLAFELVKSLVIAAVIAGLVKAIGVTDTVGALSLGLALWLAFPVMLLVGSVTQEGTPPRLAPIHAGDWLAKLLIITTIVTIWR